MTGRKLDGIKVLDLSAFLPGPHASLMLGDHGADVIMVEPANGVGEPTRVVGYKTDDGISVWFRNVARGKRSLKINLKDDDGRAFFYKLVSAADVLIEAFRPGVVQRLGIDYDTLKAVNPGLVYCSISAFGQDGPLRDRPAHDLTIQALAGVADLNRGLSDDQPAMPNIPSADAIASLMALSAILMALYARHGSGEGDYIDLSMFDALLAWTPNVTGPVFADNTDPEPKTMRSFGGAGMYNIYPTSDGQFIVLGGSEVKFAQNLLRALERVDLLDYAKIEPGPEQEPLRAFFKARFASETRAYWEAFLADIDCCWAAVRSLKDAFADPHTAHRQMLLHDEAGNAHIGIPIKFREQPGAATLATPGYGEHSEQIATELGYTEDAIAILKNQGVI